MHNLILPAENGNVIISIQHSEFLSENRLPSLFCIDTNQLALNREDYALWSEHRNNLPKRKLIFERVKKVSLIDFTICLPAPQSFPL